MADPFIAEIRIFPSNFAPQGWAFCNGQLLPIAQNTALFSLLGTTYGGDGHTVFALPDLRDRFPMHPGQGPGLSLRDLGETGGSATVTPAATQMPTHTHAPAGSSLAAETATPSATVLPAATAAPVYGPLTDPVSLAAEALAPAGGGQPHENRQPYLALNFCIALQGIYPPRP